MSQTMLDLRIETASAMSGWQSGERSLELALNRIVVAVANHMQTDVGSLYLLESNEGSLMLAATVGLLQSCVGNLRMRLDEGLVGLVAQQPAPVVLAHAPLHERFKYFPETDEDEYQSFLGVPITHSDELKGVLVVQTIEPRLFTDDEVIELSRVAESLGPLL